MENIEIRSYDIYHSGPPLWLYSQFVLQIFINDDDNEKRGEREGKSDENINVDLYGNPVMDTYFSKNKPDYDEFPKTKTIPIFKKKPKPSR